MKGKGQLGLRGCLHTGPGQSPGSTKLPRLVKTQKPRFQSVSASFLNLVELFVKHCGNKGQFGGCSWGPHIQRLLCEGRMPWGVGEGGQKPKGSRLATPAPSHPTAWGRKL